MVFQKLRANKTAQLFIGLGIGVFFGFFLQRSGVTDYDVILAMWANGVRLSRRDKGPIWLMYPLDDHPELSEAKYSSRLVWQLVRMELK